MPKRQKNTDLAKPVRSAKAGKPPKNAAPKARGQKTGTVGLRKDTMLQQTDDGPRARWPASRPEFKKR